MIANELIATVLTNNLGLVHATLADFSDAELLVRPAPGANHIAWQLGHLALSENRIVTAIAPGAVPAPDPDFARRFTKETAKSDDAALFPKKAALLDALEKARRETVSWVQTLSPEALDGPVPENLRRIGSTVGQLALMPALHVNMHIGQLQVVRRKLGKPVLF